ncbi:pimeloyl-ACP methyl ester carboxylesterase [Herbihabitans rhizosphaerae]|uniref:Pimeloyl-ACP methyl ester carboxylesterase n=1 Tax=Herbihabitans rhizosphaerae TaxID=1872711 RepID=A0A4Q7KC35_9PSEU|nr:alpha/beta hydrolase [Herbihabitans rhizosphaerae]RZS29832.1 pimeloyl-ACP methyl ester carboxylesterase [Herbihabitans rhizosphaerae]
MATNTAIPAVTETGSSFTVDGHRLAYTEHGEGESVVVLLHGQLMTRRMHVPLARTLAAQGFRVVTLDLLGHGESDRPTSPWHYSMTAWAQQVVALLEHLDVPRAVVGGTSLGANVSLEVAVAAPDRLHGLVVEMPVLDNAVVAGLIAFAPILLTARFVPSAVSALAWAAGKVPRGQQWVDVVTDTLQQRPEPMVATMTGIFFGRVAPPKSIRHEIETPALVIGHRRDPVHPFGDADMLASEMADATFVEADSPFELRFRPARLTEVISRFVAERFAGSGALRLG